MKIKFATWNIDTNFPRTEEGYARESHPEWRIAGRMDAICKKVTEINADILNLQELRKTDNKYGEIIDAITPLKSHLESIGYKVLVNPYNDTGDKTFQFITAYKQDKFQLVNTKLKYFTKTPDVPTIRPSIEGKNSEEIRLIDEAIKDNNYGEFFERGTFITRLKYIETGQELVDFNVHLAIPVGHRLKASELLNEFTNQELMVSPDAKIIISGDFNSFPNSQGVEQINIIRSAELNGKSMLTEVSDIIYLPDQQPVLNNTTFIFFPFDYGLNDIKFKEEIANLSKLEPKERKEAINKIFGNEICKALGAQLDYVFVHNLIKVGETILDITPQFEPYPNIFTESEIKAYIMNHPEGPAFASDHQPIVVELIGT